MKTITIPTFKNPFEVTVNGETYTYTAGETVEVPDEVAEIIENGKALEPSENPPSPSGGGSSEKVIHITNWSDGDNIKFSMNGFSHFHILSGSTDGGCSAGYCDCIGYITSKNESNFITWGHQGVTGGGYWSYSYYIPVSYDDTTDTVNINTVNTPITSCDGQETGLSVYIRLLNVEEV